MRTKVAVLISLAVLVTLNLAAAQQDPKTDNIPLRNWAVAFDRVSAPQPTGRFVAAANAVGAQGATFVPITPCRLVDTRNPAGPFGGPTFAAGATRSFNIPAASTAASCSVPVAAAYSLNFTIANYSGRGNLRAYPTGGTVPNISILNYGAGLPIANGAIVPAQSGTGSIDVFVATTATPGPTDVIIDINGYFTDQTASSANLPNTLVLRDANGDFSAGVITGTKVVGAVYQDFAEWVPSPALQPGMLVVLDPADGRRVIASSHSYDTAVAGVVSANPGIVLGKAGSDKSQIATTGRVKVFVDADIAPIRVGDLLVTSDVEGTAMRSMPMSVDGHSFHRPGTIVGKALQPLASGKGEILILLSLQ